MAKPKNTPEATEPVETATDAATNTATRPVAKFNGSGGLHAAVWKHPSENGPAHYSVRMDRSFRNQSGAIESSPYLRDGDVLRAQKLLGQIDDWIEQDKAKSRSQSSPAASAGRS